MVVRGTLVKGSKISSGIDDDFYYEGVEKLAACRNTATLEESGLTGEEWLIQNFE